MLRRILMQITDFGMLAYWATTSLMALSIINVPGELLFNNYHDPQVMAWNWSFLPLDLLLSATGLWALRLERKGAAEWRIWSAISMALTVCAGLMAISYWAIMREFTLTWWAPNLFLMLWPLPFLWKLAHSSSNY
jgi:Family of unknown function (DUF5360)